MSDAELKQAAEAVCAHAYAPYSEFRVGAALRTAAGNVYAGCNVENASYPLGNCAERNAIGSAVAAEGPQMRITHIAIVTGRGQVAAPCGGCRQIINEFGPAASIVLYGETGPVETSIPELLPMAFGPHDLLPEKG